VVKLINQECQKLRQRRERERTNLNLPTIKYELTLNVFQVA